VSEILILSGPGGAGKTTVARALADRYDRVAHIPVDVVRHFVTATGYARFGRPGFERQRALGTRNACALARNFVAERFAVIIDDIGADEELPAYLEGLRPAGAPVHYVRLVPSLEACQERNAGREDERMPPERVSEVYREFIEAEAPAGVTIDNSEMSPEVAADRVQALTTSGESLVWRPGP
jgi:chloramphenicol 3-O-phosphotransferase